MTAGRGARVLVLTSTFPRWPGDATPRFVADLSMGLARHGMDVTVLAPGSAGAAARERWGAVDVRRFRYGWPASTQRLADGAIMPNIRRNRWLAAQAGPFVAAQLAAAWQLMRHERFDVVHAHWTIPQGFVGAVLKRAFGTPLVITTHGTDLFALRARPLVAAKRWCVTSSDAVTAVSAALRDRALVLGADPRRVRVLPMGVDTDVFSPDARRPEIRARLTPGGPLLLFVGRLAEQKGLRFAIEAMPAILRWHPSAHLVVIGHGPEARPALALSRRLGVSASVTFAGAVAHENLPAYYAAADLLVAPSIVSEHGDTESFGLVLIEAMACGTPVISTRTGGIPEIVDDHETGVLVRDRDADAIASAATDLLADPDRLERMGSRARASVRTRFDQASMHAAYAALIERTIAA